MTRIENSQNPSKESRVERQSSLGIMFIVLSSAMQVATQNGHSTNAVQQDLHERILHISKINGGDPVTGKGFTGTSIGTEDGTGETV